MKREHFASLIILAVGLSLLAAAWITSSPSFWSGITSAIVAPFFAVLLTKWMKKFYDERFIEIYNLSSRNAFSFLIFALPAILAFQAFSVEIANLIPGLVFLTWAISMIIFYVSGIIYFYKK